MTMKLIRPINVNQGTLNAVSVSANGTRFDKTGTLVAATLNVPRIDYDPSDLTKAPRILLERASTNLLLRSEEFNTTWTQSDVSVSTDIINSPRNTLTADKIVENTNTSQHMVFQNIGAVVIGSTYTISVFAKAAERTQISLTANGEGYSVFDLSTGTITQTSTNICSITSVGNGWYRCSAEITKTDTSGNFYILIWNSTNNYIGDGISGVYLFGAQVESRDLTSYIPTTSATVTRFVDELLYDMYNNIAEPDTTLSSEAPISLWSAFGANRVYVTGITVIGSDHYLYECQIGSALNPVTISIASPAVITYNNHGLANGTRVAFQTSGALPTGLTVNGVASYYVVNSATNTFNVSATLGGSAINTSGTQSGVHVAAWGITQDPVVDATNWLKTVSSNKWKMFDQVINDQAQQTDVIAIAVNVKASGLKAFLTDVTLFNLDCSSYRVVCYTTAGSPDYNPTVIFDEYNTGNDNSSITDLYAYLTEPITRIANIDVSGLPPYADMIVTICLANTGNTVKCGECVIGQAKNIGALQSNARISLQDYSIKEVDAFGRYTILERTFNDKADYTVWVDSTQTDSVVRLLKSYRATPIVYIGEETKRCTYIYGFYKDQNMILSYPTVDILNIELEGLS